MSEVGEDIFTRSLPKSGLNTTVGNDEALFVAERPKYDRRKFPFDAAAVQGMDLKLFSATKADRMSAEDAGEKLMDIMTMFKIERQDPEVCMAFFNSLIFCMAINSSSTLTPDRATFKAAGGEFRFLSVVKFLGSDLRRFFRAYADETVVILKAILADPNRFDDVVRDKCDLIRSVALDRGLGRYPHLIGDNAEACNDLADTEHVAIATAKQSKLEGLINVADRMKTGANPRTYAAFDSTNGEFIDK